FAGTSPADQDGVCQLIRRTLVIQPGCPEACFWQGLCHIRESNPDLAVPVLLEACGKRGGGAPAGPVTPRFIDPPLYLGALLLRLGRADEALRALSEANRLDGNCPLVTWQLGTAMLAAGGDALIAVRALQKALGPRGLLLWVKTPQRIWVEGFPEKNSY